jgi:hypothetical protein
LKFRRSLSTDEFRAQEQNKHHLPLAWLMRARRGAATTPVTHAKPGS